MAEFLSSKVVILEQEPRIAAFPALQTAVPGFIGVAERGPIRTPTLLNSFEEYHNTFGGYVAGYELTQAVRAFFLSGGRACYVSRVVHYSDIDTGTVATAAKGSVNLVGTVAVEAPASVTGTATGPFDLEPADTLVIDVDGLGNETATFSAVEATRENTSDETYVLTDGMTLTVKVNGGSVQTITFNTADFVNIALATAAEVAAVINRDIVSAKSYTSSAGARVTIASDKRGTGSSIEVTGGTANAVLTFSTAPVAGTGNVANIDAVVFSEVKAIVEAAITNGSGVVVTEVNGGKVKITTVDTGSAHSIQVDASSTADGVFGLDNDLHEGEDTSSGTVLTIRGKTEGAYANSLVVRVAAATDAVLDPSLFNLIVSKNGILLDAFPNLSMDSSSERFVERVVNDADAGSNFITAVAVDTTRPDNVSSASLAGGNNGLTDLDNNDFIGSTTSATGLYAFDLISDITLLACPDNTTVAVQNKILDYCEFTRQNLMFVVLDPPAGLNTMQMLTHHSSLRSTEIGAIYWPRIKIVNPSKSIFGDAREIVSSVSGLVCGRCALNDGKLSPGPFAQPAGVENGALIGVTGLENDEVKLENKRDLLFPRRINPVNLLQGYGVFLDGARTLKGSGNFPSVGERRGVSHIERLLQDGLQFARHQNNTPELRRRVEMSTFSLLLSYTVQGSFATRNPQQAFFVDVSDELNTPSVQRAGKLLVRVGIATAKPAEFIVITISQDTRALEEELLAAGA